MGFPIGAGGRRPSRESAAGFEFTAVNLGGEGRGSTVEGVHEKGGQKKMLSKKTESEKKKNIYI